MPEPANVPPPTAADFKMDNVPSAPPIVSASKPADTKASEAEASDSEGFRQQRRGDETSGCQGCRRQAVDAKPTDVTTAPADSVKTDDAKKDEPSKDATASTTPVAPPAATATAPAAEQPNESMTAANVAPADRPVADKLHELLDTKARSSSIARPSGQRSKNSTRRAAMRRSGPEGGQLNTTAKGVIARLKDAAADGLNPADYPVPDFAAASSPDQLAEADLKLTASMMDYARHAQSGRLHWSQVSGDISYPEHPINPEQVLTNVTSAKDASAALDSYNPPQKLYRELKKKLAELRGAGRRPRHTDRGWSRAEIRPGTRQEASRREMEDSRVPMLRAKLGITENADDTHYDAKVAAAVRKFQANADLKATGVLDERTVKAINSPKRDRQIDTVVVNMERWRWLPRELGAPSLGNAYAILNIPDYSLKVMQHGAQVWSTRVVVGKPGIHATPLLTETMKYITVNPTWNVPPSIIYNEYLPALQQDPTVLERMGLKLERDRSGGIHISQPPGERNALGRIRFNFPNKFLVYQHDTPDKHLFAKEERAFSHGCMRVQNPDQYAATLLGIEFPNEHYTPEKIRNMYGRSEIDIKFPTPIPVNITYQTAFVDDGKLQIRKDVYGRDATMLALLRNTKGRDLEAVIAHAQPSYSRPKGDIPQGVAFNDDRGGFGGGFNSSGPSFLERLFGAPSRPLRPRIDAGSTGASS